MSKNKIKKSEALDILDRIIGFVYNADTKASIALGIFGAFLTIIITGDSIDNIKGIVEASSDSGKFLDCIFLIICALAIISFVVGMYKLVRVLFPNITIARESNIFFGSIAKNKSYKEYKSKLENLSKEDYLKDITSQIYINSKICTNKFKNFKFGILFAGCSTIVFLIMYLIGYLAY
ncbi:MAG: hypothetical protein KAQ68_04155 [Clostridiales bacterium]|nr:hypothetical protein [Clostridiales bacterium]